MRKTCVYLLIEALDKPTKQSKARLRIFYVGVFCLTPCFVLKLSRFRRAGISTKRYMFISFSLNNKLRWFKNFEKQIYKRILNFFISAKNFILKDHESDLFAPPFLALSLNHYSLLIFFQCS